MSSATSATTPRSWVMRITAVSSSRLQFGEQLEDLRLDGDIERRRRLVGDDQSRVRHERHRDHGSLAHAARELVRIVARPALRAGECRLSPASRPREPRRPRETRARALVSPRRSDGRPCRAGAGSSEGPGRSSRSVPRGCFSAAPLTWRGGRCRRSRRDRSLEHRDSGP